MSEATVQSSSSRPVTFKAESLGISFGGLRAVNNFNLELREGDLQGLIGPNGAGKTTIFNLITGVYAPDSGKFILGDRPLNGLPPYEITKRGIARTFQNIRLFAELTVLENVLVSYHMHKPYGYLSAILRTGGFEKKEAELKAHAMELLSVMNLADRAEDRSGSLSYGDQRRLEIARALATGCKVLLLDEPAAGLNSGEKVDLMHTVSDIRKRFKVTILLIEHDMKLVMGICERITVVDHGEIIAVGTAKEVQENPKVIEAYLGVD